MPTEVIKTSYMYGYTLNTCASSKYSDNRVIIALVKAMLNCLRKE